MIRRGLLLLTVVVSVTVLASGQTSAENQNQRQQEKAIEQRDRVTNGIVVGKPKVYDDSVLQQMLSAAQARLASLQILDQAGISARLGSITGATQQISSFALSVQGPPTSQVETTSNGATKQVVDTVKSGGDNSTETTTTVPVYNVKTTVPQFNAPTATPPAASTSMPSSFSVSASDILNEQMQLTYEIANLRLLLEGSLSDRILKIPALLLLGKDGQSICRITATRAGIMLANLDIEEHGKDLNLNPVYQLTTHWNPENKVVCAEDDYTFIRPKITLGFPIAISPDKRFKNAVAIVEVTIDTDPAADFTKEGTAPVITALLPREKTYNVAAIKDRNVSIGAGMVTQVVGVSGSFLVGRKTYYVVQDQDTLALTAADDSSNVRRTSFVWQFRPVLGDQYVKSGLKQTFVQVAFPSPKTPLSFGTIHVRSYWRKYDRKTGILKEVVKNSLVDLKPTEIPSFNMAQQPDPRLNPTDLEDLGNGQILVKLHGSFLGGTYVRIGSTILQAGSTGFTSEYGLIRFVAPISDLATKETALVTRDGTETPLVIDDPNLKQDPLSFPNFSVTALDEANSLLQLDSDGEIKVLPNLPLVLVIGGKVFGYTDAPIQRNIITGPNSTKFTRLCVVLPTAFLISNPEVTIKPLMAPDRYFAKVTLFEPSTEGDRLLLLGQQSAKGEPSPTKKAAGKKSADDKKATQDKKGMEDKRSTKESTTVRYLLYGRNLNDVKAVLPEVDLKPVGNGKDSNTLRLLELDQTLAKSQKFVILQHKDGRPYVIALPAPPSDQPKTDQPPTGMKFQERVTVGADEAVLIGEDLNKVTKILFQKKELTTSLLGDGKSLRVTGLSAAGATAAAKTQDIDVISGTSKTTAKLEVVNSKVESVQK